MDRASDLLLVLHRRILEQLVMPTLFFKYVLFSITAIYSQTPLRFGSGTWRLGMASINVDQYKMTRKSSRFVLICDIWSTDQRMF